MNHDEIMSEADKLYLQARRTGNYQAYHRFVDEHQTQISAASKLTFQEYPDFSGLPEAQKKIVQAEIGRRLDGQLQT